MNINNFESHIEEKIIDRGFEYYEYDRIFKFEKLEDYKFSVFIEGASYYSVYIELDSNRNIVKHRCNCPYDYGEYCKHEVAALFYIKDSEAYEKDYPISTKLSNIKSKLKDYSRVELEKLIIDMSINNKNTMLDLMYYLGIEDYKVDNNF